MSTAAAAAVAAVSAAGSELSSESIEAVARELEAAVAEEQNQQQNQQVQAQGQEQAQANAEEEVFNTVPVIYLAIDTPQGKVVKVETTPADAVLDVRQFLLECPETAEYTCYHLESPQTGILNDYMEIAEYPSLCSSTSSTGSLAQVKIVCDPYDERAARLHVRRLRELLVRPPAQVIPNAVQDGYENKSPEEEAAAGGGSKKKGGNAAAVADKNKNEGGKNKKKNKKGGAKNNKNEVDEFSEFTNDSTTSTSNTTSSLSLTTLENFTLTSFFGPSGSASSASSSASASSLTDCVKHLSFSGFNPPPGNRKLQGDLLYLYLETIDGTHPFHITACPDGFFVNATQGNNFNPERAEQHHQSRTMVELLRKISPQFKSKWNKACARKVVQHAFEHMDVSLAAAASVNKHSWMAPANKPHVLDWNRAEDALLDTHGMDIRGVQRDWNEEIQSCRELPKSTPQERLLRDRTLYRIYQDFVEAATKGAVAVVGGHIPPVNALDHPRSFVYIFNSIFYSFAVDARDLIEYESENKDGKNAAPPASVDKITHQMANQDLHGVKAYSDLDLGGELHTLATVLVDYRGHRVIAQSIIPGIFAGDRASKHVYGSMTPGSPVESKSEFHEIMKKAAERLHTKVHKVKSKVAPKTEAEGEEAKDATAEKKEQEEKEVELAACMETKGIIGSDGRNYVLDLLRVTPRDANFLPATQKVEEKKEGESSTEEASTTSTSTSSSTPSSTSYNSFLLRPELIRFYCRSKAFEQLFPTDPESKEQRLSEEKARAEERKKKREAKKLEKIEEAKAKGLPVPTEPAPDSEEAKLQAAEEAEEAAEEERAIMDAQYTQALQSLSFNPDAFTSVTLRGDAEEIKKDEESLRDLSKFLKEDVLKKLITSLRNLEVSPVDSRHLTNILHEHGINLRYLAEIITLAQQHHLPHIEAMAIQECIARSSKYIFNQVLRQITPARASNFNLVQPHHPNSSENMYYAPLITKFLNSFLGPSAGGNKLSQEQLDVAETIVDAWVSQQDKERKEINKAIAEAAAAMANPEAAAAKAEETKEEVEAKEESAPAATTSTTSSKNAKKKQKEKAKKAAAAAAVSSPSIDAAAPSDSSSPSTSSSTTPVHPRDIVIKFADGSKASTDLLAPANLWVLIKRTVKEKFFFDLPNYQPMSARSKLCLLRSFCLQTGLQIACRDYDLAPSSTSKNASTPFTLADIIDLLPRVKVHLPQSVDARDLLESGRAYLNQGQFQPAYQLLSESLNLHHQVYGPMHADTATVYATLALCSYHGGDYMSAADFQQRAILIYEKVYGIDSYETAHAHMHQALFLHSGGQPHAAQKHIARALYLFELIAGPNHPDAAAAHINAALICQDEGKVKEGLRHVEAALERNQLALGPDHTQVALSHHTVAVAHALLGNFRDACLHEKMSKSIYLSASGSKDPRVMRSHLWLEHFARQAVDLAKLKEGEQQLLAATAHVNKLTNVKGKKGAPSPQASKEAAFVQQQTELLKQQQAQRLHHLSTTSILPPQLLGLTSPLSWVSLHHSTAVRNRMVFSDLQHILDQQMRSEMAAAAKSADTNKEQQEQTQSAGGEEVAAAAKTETTEEAKQ